MATERIVAAELKVNFAFNPRKVIDNNLKSEYAKHIEGYLENGDDLNKVWRQPIVVTKDRFVVQGCHTVKAVQSVDENIKLNVTVLEFSSSNVRKTQAEAAYSNIHGKPLNNEEKDIAVRWALENMNLRKEDDDEDPEKDPWLSDRKLAAKLGVGRSLVNKVRNELLAAAGLIEPNNPDADVDEKEDLRDEVEDLTTGGDPSITSVFDMSPSGDDNSTTNAFEEEDEFVEPDTNSDDEDVDYEDDEEAAHQDALDSEGEDPEVEALMKELKEKQAELDELSDDSEEVDDDEEESEEADEVTDDDSDPEEVQTRAEREKTVWKDFTKNTKDSVNEMMDLCGDDDIDKMLEEINDVSDFLNKVISKRKPNSYKRLALILANSIPCLIADVLEIRKLSE